MIVSDHAAVPHVGPLGDRLVQLRLLGELHLDAEGLACGVFENVFLSLMIGRNRKFGTLVCWNSTNLKNERCFPCL
jgi:hypothetical protein